MVRASTPPKAMIAIADDQIRLWVHELFDLFGVDAYAGGAAECADRLVRDGVGMLVADVRSLDSGCVESLRRWRAAVAPTRGVLVLPEDATGIALEGLPASLGFDAVLFEPLHPIDVANQIVSYYASWQPT